MDTATERLADLEARETAIAKGQLYKVKRAPVAKKHSDFSRATADWDEVKDKLDNGELVITILNFSNICK